MTIDLEQRSEEWKLARVGKVTASRIPDVMAKTKNGPSAYRATYMGEIISERLTGVPTEKYTNAAMQWGTDTEEEARAAYQFDTMSLVETVGFLPHPAITLAGCSPDGFVGADGLIEIKCPNTSTHIETLLGQSVPGKYVLQIQFQLACSGRKWCDFVSFDPRLPESMRLWVKRIERNDAQIAEIESEVKAFLSEVDQKVSALKSRYEQKEAA